MNFEECLELYVQKMQSISEISKSVDVSKLMEYMNSDTPLFESYWFSIDTGEFMEHIKSNISIYKNNLGAIEELKKKQFAVDNTGLSFHIYCRETNIIDKLVMHRHDYFEMAYVYKGTAINHFVDCKILLNEGGLILLNPNVNHDIELSSNDACLIVIIIPKDLVKKSTMSLLKDNSLFSGYFLSYLGHINNFQDYIYFKNANKDEIDKFIQNIVIECTKRDIGYMKTCEAFLTIVFAKLARLYAQSIGEEAMQFASVVSDMLTYIIENCSDITIDDIAKKFNFSTRYVYQLLKKYTNISFQEILKRTKLQRTEHLLEQTELSISQIAEIVGFSDTSYLIKVFKSEYGVTPTDFRKNKLR